MPQIFTSPIHRYPRPGAFAARLAGVALLASLAGSAGIASAQDGGGSSTGYEVTGASQAGGGGSSSGGEFSLDGTIGQVAAGDMSGGDFQVMGGSLTPDTPMCELADLNCNGTVDGADLGLLLLNWGPCDAAAPRCIGDIDSDGLVDGSDLAILLGYWD